METAAIAAERRIWELLKKNDYDAFDAVAAGELSVGDEGVMIPERGTVAPLIRGLTTKNVSLTEIQTRLLGPDAVVVAYKASFDQVINGTKLPSPVYMMTVWQRDHGKWAAVAHSETNAKAAGAK